MSEELNLGQEQQTGDRPLEKDEPLGETGLAALKKEREDRKRAEQEARELREILKTADPAALDRLKEKLEREELEKQQIAARLEKMTKDKDLLIGEKDNAIKQLAETNLDLRKRSIAARSYYLMRGTEGKSTLTGQSNFDVIYQFVANRIAIEEDGSVTVLTPDLKAADLTADGKPKTMDDLMEEFSQDPTFKNFFDIQEARGGGITGGNGRYKPKATYEEAVLKKMLGK